MVELTDEASACCAPERQATCCEPNEKDDCCGHGESCGVPHAAGAGASCGCAPAVATRNASGERVFGGQAAAAIVRARKPSGHAA